MKPKTRRGGFLMVFLSVLPIWVLAGVFALSVSECDGNSARDDVAIPRRVAYPRINVPDSIYRPISGAMLHFEVNTSALAALDTTQNKDADTQWYNIDYPDYSATLHCTLSRLDKSSLPAAIANRQERMALNIGDLFAEITEFSNPEGFHSIIVQTQGATPLPLQFLSTDSLHLMVYGALYFKNESAINNPDSIAPIISAVNRDIIHTLKTLKPYHDDAHRD